MPKIDRIHKKDSRISEFSKVAEYTLILKTILILYTINEHTKVEIKI